MSHTLGDTLVAELNKRHAVVREMGKTVVLNEEWDHVLGRRVLTRSSFASFKNFYANRHVPVAIGKGKFLSTPLGKYWLEHPARRQYRGIGFDPSGHLSGWYNLWRGFAVESNKGDWSLFRDHIRDNLCSGDVGLFNYVLGWMAQCVQRPGDPAEVALVLRGRRGVGKSLFGHLFGRLFGQHFIHVSNSRHLVGNFNAHLEDTILLFADEAFWAPDGRSEGALKMLITEPVLPIERKGIDVRFARNVVHLLIASNNDWVVPAGLDERRFCVIDVNDTRAQDRAYFGAVVTQMSQGGAEAMLHDLIRHNLSHFDVADVPQTAALSEQKLLSMKPHEKWWFEKLLDGRLLPDHDGWHQEVMRDALYKDYMKVTGRSGVSSRAIATELGIYLSKLLPPGCPRRFQRRLPSTPGELSRRFWFWGFPPLPECRDHFDHVTQGATNWRSRAIGTNGLGPA